MEDAIAELERCAGTQFDPAIVEALVPLLRERMEAAGPGSQEETRPQSGERTSPTR